MLYNFTHICSYYCRNSITISTISLFLDKKLNIILKSFYMFVNTDFLKTPYIILYIKYI